MLTKLAGHFGSMLLAAAVPPSTSERIHGDLKGDFWMPPQASDVAGEIDLVFHFITWLSIFFFVIIVILLCYFGWKYRYQKDYDPGKSPVHNTPLELTWTIIPLFLVIAIFYVGVQGFLKLQNAPIGAYNVDVVAQKWSWGFNHPDYGVAGALVLDVPANQPVKLTMKSDDVIHSLFIPAFRVKQDIVPGRYTTLWFVAEEPGTYDLFCTEYCGTGHSDMVTRVIVHPPDEFEAVMQEKADWARDTPDALLPYRAATLLYPRCASCHSLADGVRVTGPSFYETWELYEDGGTRVMTDGSEVAVDANYLRESILDPQRHVVATYQPVMPWVADQLKDREVDALVNMIRFLDQVAEPDGTLKPIPEELLQLEEEATEGADDQTDTEGAEAGGAEAGQEAEQS